jgi:hypothetical protein
MSPNTSLAEVEPLPVHLEPNNKMLKKKAKLKNKKWKKKKIWIWEDFSTDLYHFQ